MAMRESIVACLAATSLGGQRLWLRRLLVAVIFVAHLSRTIGLADRQIHGLPASVSVGKLAVEILGIGGILVAQPVPAFPQPVRCWRGGDRRVGSASHRGEFRHVAAECEMSEEVRVLVQVGLKPEAAVRRVDVKLLVEGIQADPVPVQEVDPFAGIDPGPASAVEQRAARNPEHGRNDEIVRVSGDRVPVGKREALIVQHLANDPLELVQHESVPGQEVPLLKVFRVRGIVGVCLAAVPHGPGRGSVLRRKRVDRFLLALLGQVPQEGRVTLDPMGIPPPGPGAGIVCRQRLHDLDRLGVFREHHLAFRGVDVVADVGLRRIPGSC